MPRLVGSVAVVAIMFITVGTLGAFYTIVADRHTLTVAASNLAVIGTALLLYQRTTSKERSVEETYRFGFDLGYEEGYAVGSSAGVEPTADGSVSAPRQRHSGGDVVPIRPKRT